ncbi:MAG: SNF2 helicase-associated domain-containing protein, partial [Planctomycetota bacterium]
MTEASGEAVAVSSVGGGVVEAGVNALHGPRMLEALEADDLPESARGLAVLLEFVKQAVARGQFYPSAHRTAAGVLASWRLLIADERDVERLESVAASLPGVCFCAEDGPTDRLELVEDFLTACCDEVVRRSLAKDEFFANVHERAADPAADAEVRWVSSLLIDSKAERYVRGRDIEVATLLDKVQTWTARLGDAGGEPWRLGFVLGEPADPEDTPLAALDEEDDDVLDELAERRDWPLRLVLMPPIELAGERVPLPAEQVWNQPAGGIGFIGRNAVRLRERLASEIRRAGDFCPAVQRIADDVEKSRPGEVMLTNDEAFRLIRDWSEDLKEAAFHVELPEWAGEAASRVEVVMDLRPADGSGEWSSDAVASGRVGLDSLLSFDWRIAIGGDEVTTEEFQRMVQSRQPLIRRAGRWVEVDPQAAAAAAQLIEKRPPGELTLGEAYRTGF